MMLRVIAFIVKFGGVRKTYGMNIGMFLRKNKQPVINVVNL